MNTISISSIPAVTPVSNSNLVYTVNINSMPSIHTDLPVFTVADNTICEITYALVITSTGDLSKYNSALDDPTSPR